MSEDRHAQMGIHAGKSNPEQHVKHGVIIHRAKMAALGFVLVLLIGGAVTIGVKTLHNRNLANATEENSRTYVTTLRAKTDRRGKGITLPSTLQGMIEAPIYARATGYVVRWDKDIGSSVKKGEELAVLDTPEVDAQLAQAVATRTQLAQSLELAKSTAQRWEELREKDAVTQQDLDEKRSAYLQARANLGAADADVTRLKKLEHFKRVLAPFSGVLTRRDVEVGDLIDAGNGGAGRSLFTLAKLDPIRLYVYVPQAYAKQIKIGDPVAVAEAAHPDQVSTGKVTHIAGAIDAATRTLQVEINLPNRDNKLLAGSYVQATLTNLDGSGSLQVPSNVLLFRPDGIQIAVVDAGGKVKLHPVKIGHDYGDSVEILSGITADDDFILNPPDSLSDNDVVIVARPQASGKAHS